MRDHGRFFRGVVNGGVAFHFDGAAVPGPYGAFVSGECVSVADWDFSSKDFGIAFGELLCPWIVSWERTWGVTVSELIYSMPIGTFANLDFNLRRERHFESPFCLCYQIVRSYSLVFLIKSANILRPNLTVIRAIFGNKGD